MVVLDGVQDAGGDSGGVVGAPTDHAHGEGCVSLSRVQAVCL